MRAVGYFALFGVKARQNAAGAVGGRVAAVNSGTRKAGHIFNLDKVAAKLWRRCYRQAVSAYWYGRFGGYFYFFDFGLAHKLVQAAVGIFDSIADLAANGKELADGVLRLAILA